ncbi:MAG: hypothetical protein EHM23_35830 [Acidobacteria bacterium]|nr:MAG: hypothetical protein EHM23_35830 [Acidobacteriota bacterium]
MELVVAQFGPQARLEGTADDADATRIARIKAPPLGCGRRLYPRYPCDIRVICGSFQPCLRAKLSHYYGIAAVGMS